MKDFLVSRVSKLTWQIHPCCLTLSTLLHMNETHGPPRTFKAWMEFLTGPRQRSRGHEFRLADVFCSVDGLTLDASEALIAQGLKPIVS